MTVPGEIIVSTGIEKMIINEADAIRVILIPVTIIGNASPLLNMMPVGMDLICSAAVLRPAIPVSLIPGDS